MLFICSMRDDKELSPMHFCVPCTLLPLLLQIPHILPKLCFVMSSFPSPSLPNPLLADLAVLSSPIRLLSLLLLKACSQGKVVLTDLCCLCSEPAAPPRGDCFALLPLVCSSPVSSVFFRLALSLQQYEARGNTCFRVVSWNLDFQNVPCSCPYWELVQSPSVL